VPATDLAVDLARLLAPERVLTGASVAPYDVDGVRPAFALLPDSVSEVSAVLHFADQRRLAVVPWGGGTEIAYGNKPERFDLALDLRRLAAVIEFSPEDLVVTAQAGLTVGALNKILGGRGQFLALDVPQPDLATIGGALSVGVTGPSRPRYGTARDLVIGLTCVLAGGQVVHSGGRVVRLSTHPRYSVGFRALASGQVAAARTALGLTLEEFTALLDDALGWKVMPETVGRWEQNGSTPGDVVLFAQACLAGAR